MFKTAVPDWLIDMSAIRLMSSGMRMTILVLTVAIVGLGLTLWGVSTLWVDLGVQMTFHGWMAYGLGALLSFALAGGLFFLTFKSARDGYDDIDRPEDLND